MRNKQKNCISFHEFIASLIKHVLTTQYELKVIKILKLKASLGLFFFFLNRQQKILVANARIFVLKLIAKKKTMKNLIYNGFCRENYYILLQF
jgi:hypothetical protein